MLGIPPICLSLASVKTNVSTSPRPLHEKKKAERLLCGCSLVCKDRLIERGRRGGEGVERLGPTPASSQTAYSSKCTATFSLYPVSVLPPLPTFIQLTICTRTIYRVPGGLLINTCIQCLCIGWTLFSMNSL